MNKDPLRIVGRTRQLTELFGASSQGIDRSIELAASLRVSGRNLVVRTAVEATRKAPDAGGAVMRRLLRQAGVLTPHVETSDAFRDRLEAYEDGMRMLAREIEADPAFGMMLGLKWVAVAKTEPAAAVVERKSDADYACDFAYVLQHAEVDEPGIQRVVGAMHTHFLETGGNLGVIDGDEPALPPMVVVPRSEPGS
jgi:hypothetical protein